MLFLVNPHTQMSQYNCPQMYYNKNTREYNTTTRFTGVHIGTHGTTRQKHTRTSLHITAHECASMSLHTYPILMHCIMTSFQMLIVQLFQQYTSCFHSKALGYTCRAQNMPEQQHTQFQEQSNAWGWVSTWHNGSSSTATRVVCTLMYHAQRYCWRTHMNVRLQQKFMDLWHQNSWKHQRGAHRIFQCITTNSCPS